MNQAIDSVNMFCNYAHGLQCYYPLVCTWLIKGLFTDMSLTEPGSHQMLTGRLKQICGLLFKEDSIVYLCTQHICIFTRGYWQSTLGKNSFAHVRGKVNSTKLRQSTKITNAGLRAWMNRNMTRDGFRDCATDLVWPVITSVLTEGSDEIVCGGQRAPGSLPILHSFLTDCAGSGSADTWQRARLTMLPWWMWQPWRGVTSLPRLSGSQQTMSHALQTCQESGIFTSWAFTLYREMI